MRRPSPTQDYSPLVFADQGLDAAAGEMFGKNGPRTLQQDAERIRELSAIWRLQQPGPRAPASRREAA